MSNRQRTSEIIRDVVVFVTGAVLVASTVWLPVQGDQEVTGAILVLGILAAWSALWASDPRRGKVIGPTSASVCCSRSRLH